MFIYLFIYLRVLVHFTLAYCSVVLWLLPAVYARSDSYWLTVLVLSSDNDDNALCDVCMYIMYCIDWLRKRLSLFFKIVNKLIIKQKTNYKTAAVSLTDWLLTAQWGTQYTAVILTKVISMIQQLVHTHIKWTYVMCRMSQRQTHRSYICHITALYSHRSRSQWQSQCQSVNQSIITC